MDINYSLELSTQAKRQTMLDLFEEKTKSGNRKTILNRVVLVAKLKNTNTTKNEIGDYYDKMFKNMSSNTKAPPYQERVTGMLIMYPTLMIHVIETSTDIIKFVMKDMLEIFKNPNGLLADARILNIAHNIHTRLFPLYMYKMMNLSLEFDSSEPSDTVETLVNETVTRLLRLGSYLNEASKTQFKRDNLDNLHEQHPDYLPNQTYANYLVKNDTLLSIQEYLEYHDKPLDIVFESDLTWPAPYKLFSYQ